MSVEQAAIAAASGYAVANGFAADDRRAIGLVLAGMVIAAASSDAAIAEILVRYLEQHPDARPSIEGWARFLSDAARDEPTPSPVRRPPV